MNSEISDRLRLKNLHKKEINLKFVIIGEYGVGKTSIIKRYVEDKFPDQYKITIGSDFTLKTIEWDDNTRINLQIWDIAGHERFNCMTSVFYRHATAAAIVFDLTRPETFKAVETWLSDVRRKVKLPGGQDIPVVILANKGDVTINTMPCEIEEYCQMHNILAWFITSAKNNIQIDEAMLRLINSSYDPFTLEHGPEPIENGSINLTETNKNTPSIWTCFKT